MLPLVLFAGPVIGFTIFTINVASVGNIFFRPDDAGKYRFTTQGFKEYLKLPFNKNKREYAWATNPEFDLKSRLKLLSLNWTVMVTLGAIGSLLFVLI